ncbi:hypothetical protein C8R43DRAFT_1113603 [Mycena crocata]|nr:hypothetical protein C8R43DRAFT_1113603 [Mycena crocata]
MPHFSSNLTLPSVPDNVTLEQFILGGVGRPSKQAGICERTAALANSLHSQFGIARNFDYALLCKEPVPKNYDLSAIQAVLFAGAPLSGKLTQQLIALLPHAHIGQAYGQTEATGMVSMWSIHTKHCLRPGSSLMSSSPTVHTLADYNEPGEFFVKTPAAALGYFGDEAATKETFVDGWMRTGDQVSIKTDTEIAYIDRFEEIMKVLIHEYM